MAALERVRQDLDRRMAEWKQENTTLTAAHTEQQAADDARQTTVCKRISDIEQLLGIEHVEQAAPTTRAADLEAAQLEQQRLLEHEQQQAALQRQKELADQLLQQQERLAAERKALAAERQRIEHEAQRAEQQRIQAEEQELARAASERRAKIEAEEAECERERLEREAGLAAKRLEIEKQLADAEAAKAARQAQLKRQERSLVLATQDLQAVQSKIKDAECKEAALQQQRAATTAAPATVQAPTALGPPEFNALSDEQRQKMIARRTNIAREIYDTEKSYCDSLKVLLYKVCTANHPVRFKHLADPYGWRCLVE
jgi:hypothetical protein